MAVPKAAVNEDYSPPAGEDEVGPARQVSSMQTKPVAQPVN
jgi:hypothetical protein